MTAIAYRDGVMAADTQLSGGDFPRGLVLKIARSPKGTLGAAAGFAGECARLRRWVEDGEVDDWIAERLARNINAPFGDEPERFGAIIATAAGRVICLDHRGRAIEHDAPFHVEGSAEAILLGAMAAGASAEQAVRIAIEYDVGCGGPVQVERINAPPLPALS